MMSNPGHRITQGQFSFLPDLSDEQIAAQLNYALKHGWAVSIEYTDDPHPRNTYWEMYGNPLFDLKDPAAILSEINACRRTFASHYIRVTAFNARRGVESLAMSFLVNRPTDEPGLRLIRQEAAGRSIRYTVLPYATDRPEGQRY
jgi:ribulose-bisphosphate carboxylase small chain